MRRFQKASSILSDLRSMSCVNLLRLSNTVIVQHYYPRLPNLARDPKQPWTKYTIAVMVDFAWEESRWTKHGTEQ